MEFPSVPERKFKLLGKDLEWQIIVLLRFMINRSCQVPIVVQREKNTLLKIPFIILKKFKWQRLELLRGKEKHSYQLIPLYDLAMANVSDTS